MIMQSLVIPVFLLKRDLAIDSTGNSWIFLFPSRILHAVDFTRSQQNCCFMVSSH